MTRFLSVFFETISFMINVYSRIAVNNRVPINKKLFEKIYLYYELVIVHLVYNPSIEKQLGNDYISKSKLEATVKQP